MLFSCKFYNEGYDGGGSNGRKIKLPTGDEVSASAPNKKTIYLPDYEISNGKISFQLSADVKKADIYLNVVNPTSNTIENIPTINNIISEVNNFASIDYLNNVSFVKNYKRPPYSKDISIDYWYDRLSSLSNDDREIISKADVEDISKEKVGTKHEFYEAITGKTVTATCKYKVKAETAFGTRTLLIYLDRNIDSSDGGVPTSDEIEILGSAFLSQGLDNDIYDKMTAMFGSDIGIFNAHESNPYLSEYPNLKDYFISNNDHITILIADIGTRPRPGSSYTAGYFNPSDTRPGFGNDRAMITLNVYATGGEYLSKSLTTLSHEFQHLIHNQYYNSVASSIGIQGHERGNDNKYINVNEMFSAISELYTSYFIAAKTAQVVDGPFMVGTAGFDKGYLDGTETVEIIDWEGEKVTRGFSYLAENGRGPYTLETIGRPLNYWNQNDIRCYGLVAGMANYLLVNYGADVISSYMKNGKVWLDGIIDAINSLDKSRTLDIKTLLQEYGNALLLSSNPNMVKPYAYNKKGFFYVNKLPVYSTNLWLYKNNGTKRIGFESSTASSYNPYSVNFYKVDSDVSSGNIEVEIGEDYDDNLSISVVVVAKEISDDSGSGGGSESGDDTGEDDVELAGDRNGGGTIGAADVDLTPTDTVEISNPVSGSSCVPEYSIEGGVLKFTLPEDLSGSDVYLNVVNPTSDTIKVIPKVKTVSSVIEVINNTDYLNDFAVDEYNKQPKKIHISPNFWDVDLSHLKIDDIKKNLIAKSDDISEEGIGTEKEFIASGYVNGKNTFIKVEAICKYKETAETAFGTRTLLVYLDKNVDSNDEDVPTDEDINTLGSAFLSPGLDNDIYDKMTAMFGNDIGIINAHDSNSYLSQYPNLGYYCISNNEYITILIANIGSYPSQGSYVAGYFSPGNNYKSTVYPYTNERSMIVLNAYATGGKYMSDSLTTLSHEFQHLIHNQYHNQVGGFLSITGHDDDSTNINEMFSALSELYTSHFIASKMGKVVDGPFMVGRGGFEKGYIDGTESTYSTIAINGRAPSTLATVGWPLNYWDETNDDINLMCYGLVAGMANYLLVNYGDKVVSKYNNNNDVPELGGIVNIINEFDTSREIDMKTFMLEYGDALLLSSNPNVSKPYAYNRQGFFNVNNMSVYSTNLWLYNYKRSSSYGFKSNTETTYYPYSVNFYKVKNSAPSGEVSINVGNFDARLAIDVVLVKK